MRRSVWQHKPQARTREGPPRQKRASGTASQRPSTASARGMWEQCRALRQDFDQGAQVGNAAEHDRAAAHVDPSTISRLALRALAA
jgi:hypothetical protein